MHIAGTWKVIISGVTRGLSQVGQAWLRGPPTIVILTMTRNVINSAQK